MYLNGLIDLLHLITLKQEQNMDEQEEFEQYEEHIKWNELAKEEITTWISCVQTEAQTDQQRKVEKYKIDKYNHTT